MQETRGSGRGCGDIIFDDSASHTVIMQQLPTNNHDDQNTTTTRALAGERVGPPSTAPTLRGASGMRVGCAQLRRLVCSPRIGVLCDG